MTATPPSRIAIPPRPSGADVFGNGNANGSSSPVDPSTGYPNRRMPSRSVRQSFSTVGGGRRRVSRAPVGGLEDLDADEANAKLPTLVPGIRQAYSTPLPVLPMVVLCIAMLSELLSANLCTPFLLPMVEGFFARAGWEEGSAREATVGLWTGNLVSVFFITQFFTSLLWSSIADRHGRRAVIVASLAGSAVALTTFGTSESLPEAICVRLVQGIFGGAVGVFRGSIRDVTDETNATRAYAMLGFSWGFGGVIGPILGGVFESPAKNFPGSFLSEIGLFQSFPYLLPTFLAGIILLIGAVLACFLSWDGGVRGGSRITLPIEKTETVNPGQEIERSASPVPSQHATIRTIKNKRSLILSPAEEPTGFSTSVRNPRRDSRASLGTAYGYGGIRSKHPTLAARAALEAARRVSSIQPHETGEDVQEQDEEEEQRLNFAQRLFLANEENTFNINDLWVSAAVAQDTAVFEDEDEEYEDTTPAEQDDDTTPQASPGLGTFPPNSGSTRRHVRQRIISGNSLRAPSQGPRLSFSRRFSTASGNVPAIFGNTGLHEPAAISLGDDESSDPFHGTPQSERRQPPLGGLSVIAENRQSAHERSPLVSPTTELAGTEKPASPWKSLPLMMIIQYGLVALHNTTHDQLFLSFLVTPYKSGGIGLNPARFSLLIAMMCICQLFYQFYLYPRLGPPLGKFNHLQMFRIGCFLYIPAYLSLPLLRSVASPDSDGGIIVMTLLTMITAVRYCGGTLAYTAVMILINAMSPPHVVGLANGLAQSTVSFARFFGPVIGGGLWSASINGNPSGYASGFYVVTLLCFVQWALSFFIR